jgi:hypothetical protein
MSENLSQAVAKGVENWPWLVVDVFLVILELGALVGYKELDEPMRLFVRGMFVVCLGYFWLTGLHMLIFVRCVNQSRPMPWFVSYSLFGLKLAILVGFAIWINQHGII